MKKYLLKSFALLAMLFSAMTMSAISYCGETITATDGTTTAVLTCTQPTAGTYVMTITSSGNLLGLKGINNYFDLDGTLTKVLVSSPNYNFDKPSKTLTITLTCTNPPKMTTPLNLNFGGKDMIFETIQDQVFEWPTSCEETDKWADVDWVAGSDNKYKVLHECLTQVVSVQQPGWAEERGIYVSVPAGISDCSVNGAIDGAGMILYLSSFTAKETEVTINYAGGSCTFLVYYADGTEGGGEGGEEPDEPIEPEIVESNYCQTPLTSGTNTIYLTCEKVSEGNYQIVIEGEQIGANNLALATSGSHVIVNNEKTSNITQGSLLRLYINTELSTTSKIICEIPSTVEPKFDGPLYVNMPGEVNFGAINNIVWGTCPKPTEDNESPVMTSASVVKGSITHNSVQIAVAASDNVGVTKYVIDDKSYTATDGKITVKDLAQNTSYTLTVYAQDAAGNKSTTGIAVTFTTTMPAHVCFGSAGHFGTPAQKKVFYQLTYSEGQLTIALKSLTGYNLDYAEVQIIGVGNYGMTSDGNGGYTHSLPATENSMLNMLFLYSDTQMPGNEMTAQNLNANDANIISYYVGGCEPVAIVKDVNFCLPTNGGSVTVSSVADAFVAANAIDGNSNSRWASDASDPQWLIVDFGQRRVFNTVKLDHEGAWIKTFDIAISDDGINFVPIKSIVDQTATLTNNHYSQEIYLGADYIAQYVKMDGKARGTGYGYSLWEFEVYYPGNATLTSIECTASDVICKVGETLSLTSVAKDQHGNVMNDQTFTYTVTPADAGSVEGNTYKALKFGDAKIIATCGELTKEIAVINYTGDNVALNKEAVAHTGSGLNDIKLLTDGVTDGGTQWQGDLEPGDDRDVTCGFTLDLGMQYDLSLVAIYFEGACSEAYTLETSADNTTWATAHSFIQEGIGINKHVDYLYNEKLNNAGGVRYIRFTSTKNSTQWGMKIFEFQVFGTESASLTKAVSASVNDAGMGTATVTQNGVAVTEVETGSEVTFTATANEGHIFVNWSNGNTNPSFTTTVDAPMDLTANFRALGNIYCNTEMTVDGHTIYVTMKRSDPETYQLIVRSEENLTNFGGTNFYRSNNIHVIDLRNQGVLSEDKHILTATFSAETAPYMGTPLYVIFEGVGEITYSKLDNIEYDVECSEDVTITGLALNPASVSIMVGGSQTLKAIFTPAHAFGEELEWISSKDAIATVDANGLVTAIAEGEAVITATLVSNSAISATCNVTVTPFIANTFYGNGSDGGVDFAYSLTTNANGTITIVADVFTNNPGLATPSFSIDGEWKDMTKNADGTYTRTSEKTFSVGQEVTCFLYAPYTGGVGQLYFTYIVGSSNERPTVAVESVTLDKTTCDLKPTETAQLVATVNPTYATNKSVTWSSSDNNIATVDDNGLVTAVAAGSAIITATSEADNTKTATCTVNVMAELTDITYHASTSVKKDAAAYLGINYSITRTSDRTLRYVIKVNNSEYVDLEFNVVVNENWQRMTYDASTNTYTYTTITTYADGDVVSGFFRQIKYGVEGRWDFNYEVGTTNANADPRTMVAFNDEDVDLSHLNNGSVYDVILKRNFVMDGDWNTICLPFALTADQVKEVFGEETKLTKLSSSTLISSTEVDILFEEVTSIEAATPYLIKPEKNVNEGVFLENVTINTTPIILEAGITKMIPVLKTQAFTGENNTFFLGANEVLYKASTSGNIMAMRAYFQFSTLTPEQLRNVRARVVFNENTETSVDNITIDEAPIKVIQNGQLIIIRNGVKYNVQGQKL